MTISQDVIQEILDDMGADIIGRSFSLDRERALTEIEERIRGMLHLHGFSRDEVQRAQITLSLEGASLKCGIIVIPA